MAEKMNVDKMIMASQQHDAMILKIATDIFAGVVATEITNVCKKVKEAKKGDKLEIRMDVSLPIKMSIDAAKTFVKAIT